MWCSCHLNPPCSYCVDMPEEAVEIKDQIKELEKQIDKLTNYLKNNSTDSNYWDKWNKRIEFKEELSELRKQFNNIYPDIDYDY